MTVVAGDRTEKADRRLLRPGPGAVQESVGIRLRDQVVHEVQAGIAANEDLLRLNVQQLCKQRFAGGQAVEATIVAHVHAIADEVAVVQRMQHGIAQIKLAGLGLASCKVQREAQRAERVIAGLFFPVFRFQFRFLHAKVFHVTPLREYIFLILHESAEKVNRKLPKKELSCGKGIFIDRKKSL